MHNVVLERISVGFHLVAGTIYASLPTSNSLLLPCHPKEGAQVVGVNCSIFSKNLFPPSLCPPTLSRFTSMAIRCILSATTIVVCTTTPYVNPFRVEHSTCDHGHWKFLSVSSPTLSLESHLSPYFQKNIIGNK